MFIGLAVIIFIFGYVYLEFRFRSRNIKVNWYDRVVGGAGGVIALSGLWLFLTSRDDLEQPAAYLLIILSMVVAITLGVSAWISITRGEQK